MSWLTHPRHWRGRVAMLLAVLCLVVGTVVVLAGASGSRSGPKPAVLPDAPFALETQGTRGRIALPSVPTDAATALPRNQGAAGGDRVPTPCTRPDGRLHLRIPRLCIDAALVATGVIGGEVEIPRDVRKLGLWTGGQSLTDTEGRVGTTGTTLIVGHVDDVDQGNGALHDLYLTRPGEAVYVTDAHGHTVRWRAIAMQVVIKSRLPKELFAGAHGPRRLQLVTCGGRLLRMPDGHGSTFGTYEDNVIVTLIPG